MRKKNAKKQKKKSLHASAKEALRVFRNSIRSVIAVSTRQYSISWNDQRGRFALTGHVCGRLLRSLLATKE